MGPGDCLAQKSVIIIYKELKEFKEIIMIYKEESYQIIGAAMAVHS